MNKPVVDALQGAVEVFDEMIDIGVLKPLPGSRTARRIDDARRELARAKAEGE